MEVDDGGHGDIGDIDMGLGSDHDGEYVQDMQPSRHEDEEDQEQQSRDDSAQGGGGGEAGSAGPKRPRPSENVGHKHNIAWGVPNQGGERVRLVFTSLSGPIGVPAAIRSGIKVASVDLWRTFFTREMSNRCVRCSNRYVAKIKEMPEPETWKGKSNGGPWPPKWVEEWKPLTVKELDVWMGLNYLMGLTHKGPIKDFWSTQWMLRRTTVAKMMSRNRWLAIRRGLHAQDDDEDLGSGCKLRKIGLLLDMLWEQCRTVYIINEFASIDEQMLKFKGSFSGKFMKQAKPIREGLKFYAVVESKTGYTVFAILDTRGAAGGAKMTVHDFVMALAEKIKGCNRTVYCDNFFSGVYTFKELLKIQVYACGTCRSGRGLPANLEKKSSTLKNPGEYTFQQGEYGFLAASWFDSGVACGLSTKHDGKMMIIKRKVKGHTERVDRPSIDLFFDYNVYMGGVDMADQKRAAYTCRQRAYKWWHAVFSYISDTAMLNANVVYNSKYDLNWDGRKFALEVVELLLQEGLQDDGSEAGEVVQQVMMTNIRKDGPLPADRRLGRHYITPAETRRECAVCLWNFGSKEASKSKSTMRCKTCGYFLHVECFESFHEDEKPKSGKRVFE